jgi:hypothetical protein
MRFNEIISESSGTRLKDIAKIATNMQDADFWLVRKGSDKTVGKPVKEFDPSRIGVKVVRTDVLDPNYLYYAMMNLHNQGHFARIANGTTNLVNITVNDIANIPLGQQDVAEASSPAQQAAIAIHKKEEVDEGENWSKHNNKRVGGMSKKSVSSYRRSHPGSKIQTAVTTKPSKLKKGSKAAKRRKSFCARMKGMKKSRTSAKTARDPNSNINKSLRRWNCESIEQMEELVMLAEQMVAKARKEIL